MTDENKHVRAARVHVEMESRMGGPTFVGDTMRGLLEEIDRLSKPLSNAPAPDSQLGTQLTDAEQAIREAHFFICWTWQSWAITNGVEVRGWWHVKDLGPEAYAMMGAAEQALYDALMKTED